MPPKKPTKIATKKTLTGSKTTKKSNVPTQKNQAQKTSSKSKQSVKEGKNKQKPTKSVPTKEDIAAVQIQKNVRRFLVKKQFQLLKKRKIEYEEQIEKLEKEAYAAMVKAEQEKELREQEKHDQERRKEQARLKRVKRMLEAAFDGDTDEMQAVVDEVIKADNDNRVKQDEIGQIIRRMHMLEVIESVDKNDYTALSEASAGGSPDAIQFLIDRGADVNSVGSYGRTPLYRAAFAGHNEAVEVLLQNGADPRIVAHDSNTPAEVSSIPEVVSTLTNWDISQTKELLQKIEVEKSKRNSEVEKRKKDEKEKMQTNIETAQKESERVDRILFKAYGELEKRIREHDQMVLEGNEKMAAVTLEVS